jgi:hypothetical protein
MSAQTEQEVEDFHKKHAKKLQKMASSLRQAGVSRVHFGLDFNNDEPDLSDYAVVEYADGRTEELTEWHPSLDQEMLWGFPAGTGTYTFDASTARVLEDEHGGVIDVDEGVSRAYHSGERRLELEAEAEAFQEEMEAFMAQYEDNDEPGEDGRT